MVTLRRSLIRTYFGNNEASRLRPARDSHPGVLLPRWFSGSQRDTTSQRVGTPAINDNDSDTNKTNVIVGGTPRNHDGRAGWFVFILTFLYFSRYCRVSMAFMDWAQSAQSPSNIRRLSRKGDALLAPLRLWFQVTVVTLRCSLIEYIHEISLRRHEIAPILVALPPLSRCGRLLVPNFE